MPFDFACPDWAERLADGRAPMPDFPLDTPDAIRAGAIYDNLRLPDVPGQPRLGEAGGQWFRDIVKAAYGLTDPETGERAIGEIFCLVPKKNSKTTNSAALGLTALLMNTRPNIEMLIIGPTKEVAETCFHQAKGMIEADPIDPETGENYLSNRFHVADHEKKITDRLTGASLKVKAFDMRVVTGSIPALTIIDELHILGASGHAARVLAQIRGGMITNPDSLLVFITTQSDEVPAGVFKSELEYARKVRDGVVTGGDTLSVLYEFPEAIQTGVDPKNPGKKTEKPWRDPKLWPMVLPNLGRSITVERLLRLYRKALEKGPDEEMTWASQHLNIQLGMGTHSGGWIGATLWPETATALTLDDLLATSDVVTAGADGGGLDDLFGLALIGRHKETRVWQVWARAWAQPEVLKLRPQIAPRLNDFKADGDLVICEDSTADLREVAAILDRVQKAGLFPEQHGIGLDPFGVAALVDELALVNLEGDLLAAIGQGTKLSPAIWDIERRLKAKTMVHGGQPMLDWCVSNARTEQRGNAVLITKAVSGKSKIDPLMAVFNAAILMSRNPEAAVPASSPWDDPNFKLSGR